MRYFTDIAKEITQVKAHDNTNLNFNLEIYIHIYIALERKRNYSTD